MIIEHHKTRSTVDFTFIESVFDKQEREMLKDMQLRHPNSIIRMPNHDVISKGYVKGIGGSVPMDWDGTIVQLR